MNVLALLLLATLPVEYRPAQPRVGDPIVIAYRLAPGERLEITPGETYEVVAVTGATATLRSFRPEAFVVQGAVVSPAGRRTLRGPTIKVSSVLGPKDDLKPAPLVPPKPVERSQNIKPALIGAAAFTALASLALLALSRLRHGAEEVVPLRRADLNEILRSMRGRPLTQADIARLADATREHLALGMEMTTSELLAELHGKLLAEDAAAVVLKEGDLAKFSPWGSTAAGSDDLVKVAEKLIVPSTQEPHDPLR